MIMLAELLLKKPAGRKRDVEGIHEPITIKQKAATNTTSKKTFNSLTSATRFERQTDFLQFLNEALEGI